MSRMRWTEAETKHFVKIFLNHEILWNHKHPLHGSKFERFKQQNSIIEIFKARTGISMQVVDLKMKVRSLRSTYCQEKNKIYNRSTPEFQYKPSLIWFEDWDAKMGKMYKPQKPKLSHGGENSEDSAEHTNTTSWIDNSLHDNEVDTQMDPFAESNTYLTDHDGNDHNREAEILNRKFKLESEQHYPESSTQPNNSSISCRCLEDEFDIYAKHIASQLRSMDLEKALKLQVEIQGIVSEARISGLAGK